MQTSARWPIGTTGALWLAFLLIIGHYIAMFGIGGVLTIALGITDRREIWQAPPAAFIINIGVGLFEIGVVLYLWMGRYARLSFREAGWTGFAPRDVAYGVLGFALYAILVTYSHAAQIGFDDAIAYITDTIRHYTPQQRVFFVLMGVIAAIPEETIFRGIVQPTLQKKVGRWTGILLTAVIFAAYHVQYAFTWQRFINHPAGGSSSASCASAPARCGHRRLHTHSCGSSSAPFERRTSSNRRSGGDPAIDAHAAESASGAARPSTAWK